MNHLKHLVILFVAVLFLGACSADSKNTATTTAAASNEGIVVPLL